MKVVRNHREAETGLLSASRAFNQLVGRLFLAAKFISNLEHFYLPFFLSANFKNHPAPFPTRRDPICPGRRPPHMCFAETASAFDRGLWPGAPLRKAA